MIYPSVSPSACDDATKLSMWVVLVPVESDEPRNLGVVSGAEARWRRVH